MATKRYITLAERLANNPILSPRIINEDNAGEWVVIGDGKNAIKRDEKYYRYFGDEKVETEVDYNTGELKGSVRGNDKEETETESDEFKIDDIGKYKIECKKIGKKLLGDDSKFKDKNERKIRNHLKKKTNYTKDEIEQIITNTKNGKLSRNHKLDGKYKKDKDYEWAFHLTPDGNPRGKSNKVVVYYNESGEIIRIGKHKKKGSTTFCVEAYPNPHGKRVLLF